MTSAQSTFKPCRGCGGDIPLSKHRYRRTYCSWPCYLDDIRTDYGQPPCKRCGGTHDTRRVRGLCQCCWHRVVKTDEIHDYPRVTRRAADVAEDWAELSAQGVSRRDAAARLGMTYAAFDRALYRHAARQRALAKT